MRQADRNLSARCEFRKTEVWADESTCTEVGFRDCFWSCGADRPGRMQGNRAVSGCADGGPGTGSGGCEPCAAERADTGEPADGLPAGRAVKAGGEREPAEGAVSAAAGPIPAAARPIPAAGAAVRPGLWAAAAAGAVCRSGSGSEPGP